MVKALQELWDGDYVFAEEQLADMITLLGLDSSGLDLFPEELESLELPEQCSLEVLHFCAKQKPFDIITEGETVIDLNARNIYLEPGRPACDSFFNTGGITKGAAFLLISEVFKDFQGTFSDVTIEKKLDRDTHSWTNCEVHTAQFESIVLQDGQAAMIARFPEFAFPEGIRINKEAVTSWKTAQDAQWVRNIVVRYTMLTCPEDVPDNTVFTAMLVPKEGRALKAVPLRLRPKECGWESHRADFLRVLKGYGYEEEKL